VFGPEGSTVDVVRTGGHSRYAHGARTGYDAFRFEVPAAGPYRLRAKYPAHADGPSVALRVTDWSSATLWCGIVLTGGGAVLLTVPGVLLIALTHRARHPAAEGPAMTRGTLMETAPRSGYLGWRVVPGRWGFSLWAAATLAVAAVAFSAEGVVRPVALPLAATSGGLLAVFGAMAWRMGRLRASVPPGVHIAGDVMYVTGASRTPAAAWLELDTLTVRPLIGRARREDLHGAAVREADRFGGKVMPRGGRFFVVTPPGGRPFALGVTDPETWRPYLAGRAN
jgi:hypothetical protein